MRLAPPRLGAEKHADMKLSTTIASAPPSHTAGGVDPMTHGVPMALENAAD